MKRLVVGSQVVGLCAAMAGCGVVGDSALTKSDASPGTAPWEKPVAKPNCGPLDRTETGLHGQVPLADRLSGRSQDGYNCNLELVGQVQEQGASWQVAWYNNCAYFDTAAGSNIGVVVVDAATPSNPHSMDEKLQTAAMIDPWESLKVNQQRGLLAGQRTGGPAFAIYDVTKDCRYPQLLADVEFEANGHEGEWSPDGLTYWGSNSNDSIHPIDVSDPTKPVMLMDWNDFFTNNHGLNIGDDGTRGYFVNSAPNGLVIADTSDIQQRKPNPEIRIISEFYWIDGSTSQHTIPVTIKGRPYIIFVDELGAGGLGGTDVACAQQLPPYGFARILDISDEKNPVLVSKLMLETHEPINCPLVVGDSQSVLFQYDAHYCGVDRQIEPTVVGCGYQNSGIRVFDIRDPYHPKEIAYFNPPAQLLKQNELPGSNHLGGKTADWCSAQVRFIPERAELWTTCQDNGFMILKFTNGVWPFTKG